MIDDKIKNRNVQDVVFFKSNNLEEESDTSGNGSTEDTSRDSVGSSSTSGDRGGLVGTVGTVGTVGSVRNVLSSSDGSESGNNNLELHCDNVYCC